MERKEAIEYLKNKDLLEDPRVVTYRKFTKDEQDKIALVMKKGKIYGDPLVELV